MTTENKLLTPVTWPGPKQGQVFELRAAVFRKAFRSILTRKGVISDGLSYLVGHDSDRRGICTDVRALDLQTAIGHIPNVLNPPPGSQNVDGRFSSFRGQIAGIQSPQKPTPQNIRNSWP